MQKPSCEIFSSTMGMHVQQIYTGFQMLYKSGAIKLSQKVLRPPKYQKSVPQHLRDAKQYHLMVRINNLVNLYYDVHDSWEIDKQALKESDLYFKRSYSPEYVTNDNLDSHKILPLGLNYAVYPSSIDKHVLSRHKLVNGNKKKIKELARGLYLTEKIAFTPRVNLMHCKPDFYAHPKILFMVRAWDPHDVDDRSTVKIEERKHINETRAKCVKLLRKEFGSDFYGGFSHTEYAKSKYQNVLLPRKNESSKKRYIQRVKSYPICIASNGLHGSIGWKLAEYVAFSKAIITEKLNYQVPGNFSEGINYLAFSTPEEIVEKATLLFENEALRRQMMKNNEQYYKNYLKPDELIMRTIKIALELNTLSNYK